VQLLLDSNASLDATTRGGHSLLMKSVRNPRKAVMRVLLDAKADVHHATTRGITALHVAARYGNSHAVAMLLEQKADINHRAKNGYTPLIEAAVNGRVNVVRQLAAAGADTSCGTVDIVEKVMAVGGIGPVTASHQIQVLVSERMSQRASKAVKAHDELAA
jgi:ankyrin repeat protein